MNALRDTLPIGGTTLTDGIPPDAPVVIELGADVLAPALVLLESEVADEEHHVGRWARTYAGALAASLSGASQRIGART